MQVNQKHNNNQISEQEIADIRALAESQLAPEEVNEAMPYLIENYKKICQEVDAHRREAEMNEAIRADDLETLK